ncbi:MAG: hypothetical protein CM1200mP27_13330 [Chloroflexota bacterium]|nr:MAG: hypothetical protein CM1200mP27_13330 [Chloroflexota bacterium]
MARRLLHRSFLVASRKYLEVNCRIPCAVSPAWTSARILSFQRRFQCKLVKCIQPRVGVDDDPNEIAGSIAFISVPLGTHMGWNLRHQDIGGADQVIGTGGASGGTLRGSTIPFAATKRTVKKRAILGYQLKRDMRPNLNIWS